MTRKVYLDVCCFNRPSDDQSQDRIRLESEAVLLIPGRVANGFLELVSSDVVHHEIGRTNDLDRRERVHALANTASRLVKLSSVETERGVVIQAMGFGYFDALLLACAEAGVADFFLSTDDNLVGLASKVGDQLRVKVANPLNWLTELTSDEH